MTGGKKHFKAGIFDRLVDLEPLNPEDEHRQKQTFNKKELIDSVLQELGRLFNTRSPVPPEKLEPGDRSVLDYGIPDFSALKAKSPDDQRKVAQLLKETIESYEPRLKRVRVSLDESNRIENRIGLIIEADLVAGSVSEPILFPIVIQQLSGEVKVHAG